MWISIIDISSFYIKIMFKWLFLILNELTMILFACIVSYIITNSMALSPSREAIHTDTPRMFENLEEQERSFPCSQNLLLSPLPIQINPVATTPSNSFKIHIILFYLK
jgi:hypothetical protein